VIASVSGAFAHIQASQRPPETRPEWEAFQACQMIFRVRQGGASGPRRTVDTSAGLPSGPGQDESVFWVYGLEWDVAVLDIAEGQRQADQLEQRQASCNRSCMGRHGLRPDMFCRA
jgi:hypothetical protein